MENYYSGDKGIFIPPGNNNPLMIQCSYSHTEVEGWWLYGKYKNIVTTHNGLTINECCDLIINKF